jgi:ketosteroid isomerase-like protein
VTAALRLALAASLLALPAAARAQLPAERAPAAAAADSADAATTVTRFHQALARGDSAAALALLAPDATILESGGAETVAEYRAHHLPADIGFARAVPGQRAPLRAHVRGDVAWVVGTSTTRGEYRGRPVDSAGAELMVLTRTPQGWRIAAIHWSSRRRQG